MLKKLNQMGEYGDMKNCRRRYLLRYFDEELEDDCGHCDNCDTDFEKIDGTIIAQKALSAVARTDQRFGLSYVIDFLRGSKSKKIREQHKTLKTYGVGADISKDEWFAYLKDMISQGLLGQTEGQYPTLCLTEASIEVMKGNRPVKLFKVIERKEEKKSSLVGAVSLPYIEGLFDELKRLRMKIARNENIPPYLVFSDATLVEFATYLPHHMEDLPSISGVGDVKLQKYGPQFLSGIIEYCNAADLKSKMDLKTRAPRKRSTRSAKSGGTFKTSLRLFKSGKSVSEIATERHLTTNTIESHLVRFIPTGEIQITDLVEEEKIKKIRDVILELSGENGLKPIKEALGDDFSYGEIRAVAAEME
jgi:ATP-dependent DNA helicase RecQ